MLNKNHFLVFIGINTERKIITKNAKKSKIKQKENKKKTIATTNKNIRLILLSV